MSCNHQEQEQARIAVPTRTHRPQLTSFSDHSQQAGDNVNKQGDEQQKFNNKRLINGADYALEAVIGPHAKSRERSVDEMKKEMREFVDKSKEELEEIKEKRQECFDRIKDKNYEHIL